MVCTPFRTVDGKVSGFICSRGVRRPKCSSCGAPANKLCDYPLSGGKEGTCSRPICDRCAVTVDLERLPEQLKLSIHPGVIPGGPGDRTILLEPDTFDVCPAHARFIRAKEG